jgi:DNA-binding NtrC family response regulator
VRNRRNILVIEDHEGVRDVLCQMIELIGFGAVGVGSVAAARAALEETASLGLIISDAVLPRDDGPTIQEEALRRRLPLLMMTGHPVTQAAYETAGVDFLAKPFSIAELKRRIGGARDGR